MYGEPYRASKPRAAAKLGDHGDDLPLSCGTGVPPGFLAVAGFGSAALSCAARDRFIGWSREQQYARLIHIVNNQRFCVLPGGHRHNLAHPYEPTGKAVEFLNTAPLAPADLAKVADW